MYGTWTFGFPVDGYSSSDVHTFVSTLMSRNFSLFSYGMFSFNPIRPEIFPFEMGDYWISLAHNPPLFYFIGGIFSFFITDIVSGYFTAALISSFGIVIVFYFLYKTTKINIAFICSFLLSLNAGEIYFWQMGWYESLLGIVLVPLSIFFLHEYFKGKCIYPALIVMILILLSYELMIIFPIFFFFFYILLNRNKKSIKKFLLVFFLSLLLCSFFLYKYFFYASGGAFIGLYFQKGYSFMQFDNIALGMYPSIGSIIYNPLIIYLGFFVSIIMIFLQRRRDLIFYYMISVSSILILGLIFMHFNLPFSTWFTRFYSIIPQLTIIGLAIPFEWLYQRTSKINFYCIVAVFIAIYLIFSLNVLSSLVERHSLLDSDKYEAMLWIRKNTEEKPDIVLLNDYEHNGWDWLVFFMKDIRFPNQNEMIDNFSYVIINDVKGTDYKKQTINLLLNNSFKIIFKNNEVSILKK